jgi:hypothetical protein
MKYYKRMYSEQIQRFNKDWSARDWYYFEIDENYYAVKQIQRTYEGKIFKHDENNMQDEFGGLAEGVLDIECYTEISNEEFYAIWNKQFSNTYLVKQFEFDSNWEMAWYNIDYNKTEQELCDENLILCGSYHDIFLLDIEYGEYNNFLSYNIHEGSAGIKYGTVDNWDELVSCVQLWINYIEKNASKVYAKPEAEKIERPMKILIDGRLQDATFAMYCNMDRDIEKFRGAYLKTETENFAHINTYIGIEDLLISLQEGLPENMFIQSCLFCRFSHFMVAGNDNYGDLNCFKHCKQKCESIATKNDVIDLFNAEFEQSKKVEETYYCNDFESIKANNYVYKKVHKLKK